MASYDYVLAGGGLHNGLFALSLLHHQPGARIALIESLGTLGGNHTWCFHGGDVPSEVLPWFEPLVAARWPGFDVRFPHLERSLELPYGAVTSERFDHVLRSAFARAPGSALMLGCDAVDVGPHSVVLRDGSEVHGTVVIDSRGPARGEATHCGYQKFVGLEVETEEPTPFARPVLMDARLEQVDGYRFMYVLPFSPTRCLVEDTRFSDNPALDCAALRATALGYLEHAGIRVKQVLREESGVLPMPWRWTAAIGAPTSSPLRAGYAAGWFHAGTGYSLPAALRLAHLVGTTSTGELFGPELDALHRDLRDQSSFFHVLNWMLFHAVRPELRWDIFERFHTQPPETITRFYAMRTTLGDRARILSTRPPKGLSIRRLWDQMRAGIADASNPTVDRSAS